MLNRIETNRLLKVQFTEVLVLEPRSAEDQFLIHIILLDSGDLLLIPCECDLDGKCERSSYTSPLCDDSDAATSITISRNQDLDGVAGDIFVPEAETRSNIVRRKVLTSKKLWSSLWTDIKYDRFKCIVASGTTRRHTNSGDHRSKLRGCYISLEYFAFDWYQSTE